VSTALWVLSLLPASRSTVLTLLPAPGSVLVFDGPGRSRDHLINCSNARSAEQLVRRFLRAQGFGSIPALILSQGDVNHAGGAPLVMAEFAPRTIYTGRTVSRSRPYRQLLAEIKAVPGLLRNISTGDELLGWRVLQSSAEGASRAADNALVLKTDISGWTVLYLGDLSERGQGLLLERNSDLRADILICAASGKDEVTPGLVQLVAPRLIVIGAVDAPFERRAGLRARAFHRFGVPVVTTANDSAVVLEMTAGRCTVQNGDRSFTLER
jgi:beta-lactamase superfamily II metal-dependent hydrolase